MLGSFHLRSPSLAFMALHAGLLCLKTNGAEGGPSLAVQVRAWGSVGEIKII